MDAEKSGDISNVPDAAAQQESLTVNEVASKLQTPVEPEKLSAAEQTQNLAVTGDKEVMEVKDTPIKQAELIPDTVAESDESSKKVSGPVTALSTEPENIHPVPENTPEHLAPPTTLAASVPVPAPEKLAASVPEAEPLVQTSPQPATLQQPVEAKQAEKSEPQPQTAMDSVEQKSEEKPVEGLLEAVALKEESAENVNMKPPEDEKKSCESDVIKEAELSAAEGEVVKSEQKESKKDTVPSSGSLSFALLQQEKTKDALRTSRTLVVLRGLPGSGKSFLARTIAEAYKGQCCVLCADDHGVKPENPESSVEGYKALDDAVAASCSAGTASSVIVVDDTNHTHDRLARFWEIAEQHRLVTIFLEPRTEWGQDVSQLTKKTGRGLKDAQMQAMKGQFEETSFPLYFGWFLLSTVQDKVGCTAMDFLKTLDTLEAFKKHLSDFTGKPDEEVDLEQYFQARGLLHCTTKFCNYGKAEGAKEYAENPSVAALYGSVFELSLSALFVTPRTFGARVSLSEEQLLLWPSDAEKEVAAAVPAAASLPPGSRAHITLGCAKNVEAVQTGLDLLQILAIQKDGQQGEQVEEMELGSLTYYGEGRWMLSLREPICALACFSSFYGPKECEQPKKEPEKKKKLKCIVL
ncbi:2',3'-cyclic-nucleotide 3'-phosphodiesterase [Thalassophryne amazonica]|uniref:2',3'-cyclic-nucleotide 3'-phosphodiesterase n=1 Tax=Thalassophryne amazonica TaxID=390379 RepID=UPI00147192B8|nr:2',3'-cyclic-nucleotide 3'-phosphodiesterase [Thalassophryne amazonica]